MCVGGSGGGPLTRPLSARRYCDCFANGEFCNNCNCNNCFNNLEHETERLKAIKVREGGGGAAISRHTDGSKLQLLLFFSQTCLDRNPEAFKPKIGKGKQGESDRRHSKGCNCKRSGCLKNYCECYEVGPPFTPPGRPPCASSRFF